MVDQFDLWVVMVMITNTFKALTLCPALTYTVNLYFSFIYYDNSVM